MDRLPDELLCIIRQFLTRRDRITLARVCRFLHGTDLGATVQVFRTHLEEQHDGPNFYPLMNALVDMGVVEWPAFDTSVMFGYSKRVDSNWVCHGRDRACGWVGWRRPAEWFVWRAHAMYVMHASRRVLLATPTTLALLRASYDVNGRYPAGGWFDVFIRNTFIS
jgi:hypothetical protein